MVGEGEDMTVAQLIVELQKLPQGAPVQAVNLDWGCPGQRTQFFPGSVWVLYISQSKTS